VSDEARMLVDETPSEVVVRGMLRDYSFATMGLLTWFHLARWRKMRSLRKELKQDACTDPWRNRFYRTICC